MYKSNLFNIAGDKILINDLMLNEKEIPNSIAIPAIETNKLELLLGVESYLNNFKDKLKGAFNAALDIFYNIIEDTDYDKLLIKKSLGICNISTEPWLDLLLACCNYKPVQNIIIELIEAFKDCDKLPTGIALHISRKKAHIPREELEQLYNARKLGIRTICYLSVKSEIKDSLLYKEPICRTLTPYELVPFLQNIVVNNILVDDLFTALLGTKSLLNINASSVIEKEILESLVGSQLTSIFESYKLSIDKLNLNKNKLFDVIKVCMKASIEKKNDEKSFDEMLFSVSEGRIEDNLDLPLQVYLDEYERLNGFYIDRNSSRLNYLRVIEEKKKIIADITINITLIRCITVYIVQLLLISLKVGKKYNEYINCDYYYDLTNYQFQDIFNTIKEFPWHIVKEFSELENIIFPSSLARLLASLLCRFTSLYQQDFTKDNNNSWVFSTLQDLANPNIPWYNDSYDQYDDSIYLNESTILSKNIRKIKFKSTSRPSLGTRINSSFCINSIRKNYDIKNRFISWKKENVNIKKSKINLDQPCYLWSQIIIECEQRYKSFDNKKQFCNDDISDFGSDSEEEDEVDNVDNDINQKNKKISSIIWDALYSGEIHLRLPKKNNKLAMCRFELDCAYLVNKQIEEIASDILMVSGLEGNGDHLLRVIHPLDIVSYILANDSVSGTALQVLYTKPEIYLFPLSRVLTESSGHYVESHIFDLNNDIENNDNEVCDELYLNLSLKCLEIITSGPYPSYSNPSEALPHEHYILGQHQILSCNATLNEISIDMNYNNLVDIAAAIIYNMSEPSYFLTVGIDGISTLERAVKFLCSAAAFDINLVKSALKKNCQWNNLEDAKYNYCLPFYLVLNGGSQSLFDHCVKSRQFSSYKISYDPQFQKHLLKNSRNIQICFIELFSILTTYDRGLCRFFTSYGYNLAHSLSSCLSECNSSPKTLDNLLAISIYRLSSNLVAVCRDNDEGAISFESNANQFRLAFAHEGKGLFYSCNFLIQSIKTLIYYLGDNPIIKLILPGEEGDSSVTNEITTTTTSNLTPSKSISLSRNISPLKPLQSPSLRSNILAPIESFTSNYCWKQNDYKIYCRIARNVIISVICYLIQMCEGRMEIQKAIALDSPDIFLYFPTLLIPHNINNSISSEFNLCTNIPNYHSGIAALTSKIIRFLAHRSEDCQKLINTSGCVEGLMISLLQSSPDKNLKGCVNLSKEVVFAIEKLIVFNNDKSCWKKVQKVGGIAGLLQLCTLGNSAVRIVCCATMATKCTNSKKKMESINYRDNIIALGGVNIIFSLMKEDDPKVQMNALGLMKVLMSSQAARVDALTSTNISAIGVLIISKDVAIARASCELVSILGADNPHLLRSIAGESIEIDGNSSYKKSTIISRLMDLASSPQFDNDGEDIDALPPTSRHPLPFSPGTPKSKSRSRSTYEFELQSTSMSSANALAAMTDGDESDWQDGAPDLRRTLRFSGILPTLQRN